jgi:hypothetical protein
MIRQGCQKNRFFDELDHHQGAIIFIRVILTFSIYPDILSQNTIWVKPGSEHMETEKIKHYTGFYGNRCIGAGVLEKVVRLAKPIVDRREATPVMIFDDDNGESLEVDYRGKIDDIIRRLNQYRAGEENEPSDNAAAQVVKRGPGRPRLGVVAREVTLLPRHWQWLNRQPGGASVALRRLVDQARHAHRVLDAVRLSREAAYRFISVTAGNEVGFEEANRALFAGNREGFEKFSASWPTDIQNYALKLAEPSFPPHVDQEA